MIGIFYISGVLRRGDRTYESWGYRDDVEYLPKAPTRLVPLAVSNTAKKKLDNPLRAARYVYSAFCVYRETTNYEEAPHIFKGGVLEWPDPVPFSWTGVNQIIAGRNLVLPESENARVELKEGGFKRVTEIDVETGERKARIEKRIDFDRLGEKMKYSVPSVHNITLVDRQEWERISLMTYANYLAGLIRDLKQSNPIKDGRLEELSRRIEDLRQPVKLPAHFLKREQ